MTGKEAMTRQEAINKWIIPAIKNTWNENKCKEILEALEQETILDKIRAEIENINLNEVASKYEDRFYGFQQEVIKILDKYKAESEE